MKVIINIEYVGAFAAAANAKKEEILVDSDIKNATIQLQNHIEKYNIRPPYLLFFENIHILRAIKQYENNGIKDGNTFRIMPFLSGG